MERTTLTRLAILSGSCCLLALSCCGQVGNTLRDPSFMGLVATPAEGGAATFACEIWEDFEFDSLTTGNLAAQDHGSIIGWAITDASTLLSTSTNGERATLSQPQSTADTGTRGLKRDWTTGAVASYLRANILAVNNLSIGFWFKGCTMTNATGINQIFRMLSGGTGRYTVEYQNNSGTYRLRLNGSGATAYQTVSPDTWYWITSVFLRNNYYTNSVYSEAGALVSSTNGTVADFAIDRIYIGVDGTSYAAEDGKFLYWDDFCVNTNTAAFPLGP